MSLQINSFLKGYAKSLEIMPDFQSNNQNIDWINIGLDIKISIKKYERKKNGKQVISERKK